MFNEKRFEEFIYFFSCYFTLSDHYADLPKIVSEYRELESKQSVIRFLTELTTISTMQNTEPLRNFLRKKCLVQFNNDKILKETIKILINTLSR